MTEAEAKAFDEVDDALATVERLIGSDRLASRFDADSIGTFFERIRRREADLLAASEPAQSATRPESAGVDEMARERLIIWLAPEVVKRLRALRGPGESYSNVILRLVELEARGKL
jgi:hypothetical protein